MFQELRESYRPEKVEVLFVGESPPPSGTTFFYAGNSRLFRHWKDAFGTVFETEWQSADQFLRWYRGEGCYLEDLLEWPVPPDRDQRRNLWPESVGHLAFRIEKFQPRAVVTVMKAIGPFVAQAISESCVSTHHRICGFPFPGRHFRQSEQEARDTLSELKRLGFIAK